MLHECYMNVTFRFCHRSQSKSFKLPVFKGISADLSHHRFYHISFYPLYIRNLFINWKHHFPRAISLENISEKKLNKKNLGIQIESQGFIYFVISKKLLLVDSEVDSYGDSYSSTYHWVVTHTEEAHHLYVSRN